MKPELRIALLKESEGAKRILEDEYSSRWLRLGYVGVVAFTVFGIALLTSAISYIADYHKTTGEHILGSSQILLAFALMLAPWYVLLRYIVLRKIRLLSEAILSTSQFEGFITG